MKKNKIVISLEDAAKEQSEQEKKQAQINEAVRVLSELSPEALKSVNFIIKEQALHNAPTNAEELYKCVKTLFHIDIPYTACSEDSNAPYEWFYKCYFGKVDQAVAMAARLSGKTFLASILHYLSNTYKNGYTSRHAAANREQAAVASNYLREFGRDEVLSKAFDGKPGNSEARWKSSNGHWKIVTGSLAGVSGQHPNLAVWDEVEFWKVDALEQTWYVPQSKNGHPKLWLAISTRQRCLPYYARIITEDGPKKIGDIVNKKYTGKVKSLNKNTGNWEWKQVVDWHNNGSSKEWYKVYLEYTGLGRGGELVATGNHHVYYDIGKKKPLKDFVVGDTCCVPSLILTEKQRQVMIGTLLGDGSLSKGSLRIEHSSKQVDYLRWKGLSIGLSHSERWNQNRNHYLYTSKTTPYLHRITKEWYSSGQKRIPNYVWDELDNLGLAVWLMDDGSYRKAGTKKGGDTWHIYCQHFSDSERTLMYDWFYERGIHLTWQTPNKDKPYQKYAYIGGESARKLTNLVKDYIDVSKKLPGKRAGYKQWIAKPISESCVEGVELVPISKIEIENTKSQGCYDITVEDNHNFLNGSQVLVSNSFGAMNWLVDNASSKAVHVFKWTAFETMKRCQSCVAIDKCPNGTDAERQKVCNLWEDCHGKRGTKSSGWVPLHEVQKLKRTLSPEAWKVQGICEKPSSSGLVLLNFEHANRMQGGNYTYWTYQPELPLYVTHDPAEGKKSCLYFIQIHQDSIYVFDEIVQEACPNVSATKSEFYRHCMEKGYADPVCIVVDPRKTDAVADWRQGTQYGEGLNRSYKAVTPAIDKASGGQVIAQTIEFLRKLICDGDGVRRLYVNPLHCPKLVRGIREYHYPTDMNNVVISDTPDKEYSDEIDPLRYFAQYYDKVIKTGNCRVFWLD